MIDCMKECPHGNPPEVLIYPSHKTCRECREKQILDGEAKAYELEQSYKEECQVSLYLFWFHISGGFILFNRWWSTGIKSCSASYCNSSKSTQKPCFLCRKVKFKQF